jgi:arabinose-5-phosphate isomerase
MKDIAKRVFDTEIESLQHIANAIDDEFTKAVQAILANPGKLIIAGVGKSGIIGKKIAATLTSTGTPSFFSASGRSFSWRYGDSG